MKKLSAALLLLTTTAYAQPQTDTMTDEAISKRIAPVGAVYLKGAAPAVVVPTGPRTGKQVYTSVCAGCHGTGALGAPKTEADWAPRVAQGMDTLMNHALNGFNSMPPKGTCMDCSDDEIKAAIEFMSKGI